MATNVLQVLFNMSDVAVVGRFAGPEALGSVGSTSILVSLFTGFPIGMGAGVNVVIARFLGMRDERRAGEGVRTAFWLCLAEGLLLALVLFFTAAPFLTLLGTKDVLMAGALRYLRIYAFGLPAMALYNGGAAVLSAKGDTRRPLLFLTGAGILNILMNLAFVILAEMAEASVALASVLSQYTAALLVLLCLLREKGPVRLSFAGPGRAVNGRIARMILSIGLPSALQYSIFAVANLFIQSAVNSFDALVVEGNSAAQNADGFAYDIMAAVYTACSAFMSCNLGARKAERVIRSYLVCLVYSFLAGALIGGLLLLFGPQFLSLFTTEADVIAAGTVRLRIMSMSYAFSAFMDCTIAASRGIDKPFVPTLIVIGGSCLFRILWIYTVFAHFRTIGSLYSLYIVSWTLTAAAEMLYFRHAWKSVRARLGQPVQQRKMRHS